MSHSVEVSAPVYLEHYLQQSSGWIKIAGFLCDSVEAADRREADIRTRYPNDTLRFERH